MITRILVLILGSVVSTAALAQLEAARTAAVAYGHHHINTTDIDAQRRFWVEGLGGRVAQIGTANREVIAFPNVLVLFSEREHSGGTRGSIVNHVGFETQNIVADVERLISLGYTMISREELPDVYEVENGIARRPGGNTIAYVLGPDDLKVELIENTSIDHPVQMHHIHWAHPEGEAMQQWYAEHFGGVIGTRIGQPAIDLPGVNLTYGPGAADVAATQGRALDHIGFEVDNLQAFVAELESKGITMDRGYTEVASLGIAIAFLTDPWGTYIELTEGLDADL
jgi:catechol 2,3-dioxygenase-like lactoylglutathione lyase family enzyme